MLLATIAPAARSQQVVTSAAVTGSSVVRHEGDTAVLLLFVNQTTSSLPSDKKAKTGDDGKQTSVGLSRVRVTMQKIGDAWHVQDLRGI